LTAPPLEAHESRETNISGLVIHRALPVRGRRMIGPWCFLDRFGPMTFAAGKPMDVGAHPHTGIQTVSWLLEGESVHHDSLGNEAALAPGGVNVMTAGAGIAHAEETPVRNSGRLSGVQLWVALKDAERNRAPSFEHVAHVPSIVGPGGIIRVFSGGLDGAVSPAPSFSELVGAEVEIHPGETLALPFQPTFEHGFFLLSGDALLEGQDLDERTLYYLGPGRTEGAFSSARGARVLLLGGPPFGEKILMWWNFVARSTAEIREAREDWQAHRRFAPIRGHERTRIPAPELLRLAEPNPLS
jgi:redox-sensitive bicupin YhaK (pirin superfamily)